MLRFLGERRAWVVAVVAALLVLLGAWFAAVQAVPGRVSNAIHGRFGLDAEIGETEVGLSFVELRDLRIRDATEGLLVQVDRIVLQVTPWGALLSGAGAVEAVVADGVGVWIDLDRPGIADSLRKLGRSRSVQAQASSDSGGGRAYSIRDLQVRVRDSDGELVRVEQADLSKEGDEIVALVVGTRVGDLEADHASVGPTTARFRRSEGVWALRELSVDRGSVRWHGAREAEAPLATRLRRAWQSVRRSEPGAEGTAPEQTHEASERPRLLSRVSPDAQLRLTHFDVESRAPGGHLRRIRELDLSLIGENDGWFRLSAGGQTSNDGLVEIDLRFEPVQTRAEGSMLLRGVSLALLAPLVPEITFYEPEGGTMTAALELDAGSPDEIHIDGRVTVRDAALFSERLAPEPIEQISLTVTGKGTWYPLERRLAIAQGSLRMGSARVLVAGELERASDHYRVELIARMPPAPCNEVVGAIPKDVIGPLKGFSWTGTWGGIATLSLDSRDLEATEMRIRVRDLCEFVRVPRWVRVERFQEPFRHTVVEPDESVFELVTGPGTDPWVPLADVSPFLVQAVLSHEDARFYDHGGFAPWAIREALVRNLQEGAYVVGASTISMQLAKNLYLKREKTIARKVQEVILTWWLEHALEKDDLLELYLNVIEYGPGIYGIKHAAAHYFGRMPTELSPAEAAFLATILPAPKRYHASYERDELSRGTRSRMTRLLEHMADRERIGDEALTYGLAEIEEFDFHQEEEPLPGPRTLPPVGAPEEPTEELDPFEALFIVP